MTILLTGYKPINYQSKSGNQVTGVEVYGVIQDSDDKVVGKSTLIQYIPDVSGDDLVIDEYYAVKYDIRMFNNKPVARAVGLELLDDFQA